MIDAFDPARRKNFFILRRLKGRLEGTKEILPLRDEG